MNQFIPWLFYVFIAGLCAANWIGAYREDLKLYHATKPLVLLAMIGFFAYNDGFSAQRLPFLIGLVLSVIGDVFLMAVRTRYFIAGMAAFALAHVAYIYGFSQWAVPFWAYIPAAVALLIMVTAFSFYIETQCKESSVPRFQKRLFKAYGVLVAGMALVAWLSLVREGWTRVPAIMAGLGGSFFTISDLMIALGRLEKRIPRERFWVISSYHIAQMLILSSVLLLKA